MKRRILILGILVVFLVSCHQTIQIPGPKLTPNLDVINGLVEKKVQIDERTALLCAFFPYKNTEGKELWLYLSNKDQDYKVLVKYLDIGTDNEIAVLYIKEKPMKIGPVGKGIIKKDFVSFMYYPDNTTKDIMLRLTHRKDFNIETKESKIEAIYEINLSNLAKKLWQGGKG